jgi:hypothetical protein
MKLSFLLPLALMIIFADADKRRLRGSELRSRGHEDRFGRIGDRHHPRHRSYYDNYGDYRARDFGNDGNFALNGRASCAEKLKEAALEVKMLIESGIIMEASFTNLMTEKRLVNYMTLEALYDNHVSGQWHGAPWGTLVTYAKKRAQEDNVYFYRDVRDGVAPKMLLEEYIIEGSPEQINISGDLRNRIVAAC